MFLILLMYMLLQLPLKKIKHFPIIGLINWFLKLGNQQIFIEELLFSSFIG